MTRDPLVVSSDTRLSDVVELMEKNQVLHFPVVDDGRLVGLLSERHLRDAMPSILTLSVPEARRRSLAVPRVSSVCVRDPVTVDSQASVLQAIRLMRHHRAGCLPVTSHGALVGVLTSGDLIRLLERLLES